MIEFNIYGASYVIFSFLFNVLQFLSNINILYSYVIKKPGNNDTLLNGYAEAMVTSSG